MLLLIKKESANLITVTLNEKADLDLPVNWLFRFIREQTNKDYFVNLFDLSLSQGRYNLFNLYEGFDLDLPEGEYRYEIYQNPTTGIDFSNGILCETGKAKVYSDPNEETNFNNTNTLINVYE